MTHKPDSGRATLGRGSAFFGSIARGRHKDEVARRSRKSILGVNGHNRLSRPICLARSSTQSQPLSLSQLRCLPQSLSPSQSASLTQSHLFRLIHSVSLSLSQLGCLPQSLSPNQSASLTQSAFSGCLRRAHSMDLLVENKSKPPDADKWRSTLHSVTSPVACRPHLVLAGGCCL